MKKSNKQTLATLKTAALEKSQLLSIKGGNTDSNTSDIGIQDVVDI